MKMFKYASMLLGGLAALMLSVAANAAPVSYTGYSLKYGTSGAPVGTVTYGDPSATTPRIYAGELTFNVSGGGTFNGFCIDLSTTLRSSGTYTPMETDGLDTDALGALFELYYSDSGMGQVNTAAFQLAVWSIIYGSDSVSLLTSTFGSSVATQAETYLRGVNSFAGTSSYAFLVFDEAGNQNMLTWTRVPEPGTLALLGLGLLGAGAIRRRRS